MAHAVGARRRYKKYLVFDQVLPMDPYPTTAARVLALFVALSLAVPPLVLADSVRILDDDAEALGARFELISAATERIDVAYFIVEDDAVSLSLFARLREAARRGVRVRVLVDAHRNGIPRSIQAHLLREGIELREYHPLRLDMLHLYAYRMHDKLLVRDGNAMILGGRNIGEAYFERSSPGYFRDRDVVVTGLAARAAQRYFERLWASDDVAPVSAVLDADPQPQRRAYEYPNLCRAQWMETRGATTSLRCGAQQMLDAAQTNLVPGKPAERTTAPRVVSEMPPGAVRFLYSASVGANASRDITTSLLDLIGSARRDVVIETPYLILSERFLNAIDAALDRGVAVRIVTNSLATTNQMLAHAGYANQKAQLVRMGIDLWEYEGEGHLHAKSLVVDDQAVVGSYNFNPRSEYFDTEVAVLIRDAALAAELRDSIDARLADAVRVRETVPSNDPQPPSRRAAPPGRAALLQIFRVVTPAVHRHL